MNIHVYEVQNEPCISSYIKKPVKRNSNYGTRTITNRLSIVRNNIFCRILFKNDPFRGNQNKKKTTIISSKKEKKKH